MTVNPSGASLGGPSAAASPLVESGRRISDELNRKPQKPMALSPKAAETLEELHADGRIRQWKHALRRVR